MKQKYFALRMNLSDFTLLQKVCGARGEEMAAFARRAIRKELSTLGYYPEEVKKALGIESTSEDGGS